MDKYQIKALDEFILGLLVAVGTAGLLALRAQDPGAAVDIDNLKIAAGAGALRFLIANGKNLLIFLFPAIKSED